MNKIYEFRASGCALGSTIVVISNNLTNAMAKAKTWLRDNNQDQDSIELEKENYFNLDRDGTKSQIVYAWNGDY